MWIAPNHQLEQSKLNVVSKLKPGTTFPTPAEDEVITKAAQTDPDAAPYTDEEWAQVKLVRSRGRPVAGAGWQKRMNDALKDWLKTHTPA